MTPTPIADRCTEVETGARNVDHIITGSLMPKLANEILSRMSSGDACRSGSRSSTSIHPTFHGC